MRKMLIALGVCAALAAGLVVWHVRQRSDSGPANAPVPRKEISEAPGSAEKASAQSRDKSEKAASDRAPGVGEAKPRPADGKTSDSAKGKVPSSDTMASRTLPSMAATSRTASADRASTGTLKTDTGTSTSLSAIPKELAGFKQWSESKRVKVVTEMMRDPNLSDGVKGFFKRSLHDKSLSPLVRNNMANALNTQERKDPGLYKEFLAIVDDRSENEVWRAYSIQFLGETFSYCADRKAVESKLFSLSESGEGNLDAQAMVTLGYLEREGNVKLDKRFDDRIVEALKDPNTPEGMRMTVLGIVGQRGDKRQVDLVRQCASQPSASQRVAVATLGLIGDQSDIARIEPLLQSKDPLVRNAAMQAVKRLKEGKK